MKRQINGVNKEKMKAKVTDKKFSKQWEYQQALSDGRIKRIIKQLAIYFPLAYVEFFVYILISVLAIPIVLARGLYHWLRKVLTREIAMKDFDSLPKEVKADLVQQAIDNIELSMNLAERFIVFIFGVGATLLGLFLSNYLKN